VVGLGIGVLGSQLGSGWVLFLSLDERDAVHTVSVAFLQALLTCMGC
jgi:hypothetical protein